LINIIDTLNDIQSFLESNLIDYLTEVESNYSITIDHPKELGKGRQRGQQFPSIGIEAQSSGSTDIIPGNAGVSSFPRRIHFVNLVIWHRGNDTQTRNIEENVLGYTVALERLFTEKADLDNEGRYQLVLITSTGYTDLIAEPVSKTSILLLKGATFSLEIRPNITGT
jgi:hypothetical protein